MARYSCHLLCAALLSFGAFGLELITTGYLVSDGSAEQACQDTFHTSLASLHSADEQAEAQELCSFTGNTVYCWLGGVHTGTAAAANCEYSWNDGSTFDESVLHRYSATEYCSSDQYMCIVPDSSNAAGLHECTGNGELFYPICSSPEKVTRIGVVSAGLSGGASAASTTLTLWYDSTVYQCVVTVAALNTEYACDSSSIVVLGDDCSSTDTKMLFDQNSNDAVIFDSVFFETADGSTYTVDGFCMAATETALVGEVSTGYQNTYGSPTAEACTTANGETGHIWQSICVDLDDCLPYKQVLYFDTAQPNVAITDAQWDSGMDIEAVANDESCYEGCADQTTMREVVAGSIYACPGTFSGGGTRGAEAAALCASDYHVCES
eukprot:CAMPEP_0197024304 /NCGR_PEP_ID=MMETSP1384-20130603/4878_1 /TAXON_ID=29189 /ORGANISM="Ammonia sp." /LENGTH=379 /DNA_ID=CAMNT_0042452667 /DNA_START=129 /DNA_END=1265 /DNA_ORIENTATION=+